MGAFYLSIISYMGSTQFNKNINILLSDNGGTFHLDHCCCICKTRASNLKLDVPMKQQNDLAKRKRQHVHDMAHSLSKRTKIIMA